MVPHPKGWDFVASINTPSLDALWMPFDPTEEAVLNGLVASEASTGRMGYIFLSFLTKWFKCY